MALSILAILLNSANVEDQVLSLKFQLIYLNIPVKSFYYIILYFKVYALQFSLILFCCCCCCFFCFYRLHNLNDNVRNFQKLK